MFKLIYDMLGILYSMLFKNERYNDFNDYKINEDFKEFKQYKTDKVIYILNNLPSKVYNILYNKYDNVSDRYFQIILTKNNGEYDISHCKMVDFDNVLKDNLIRYVYIRVNLDDNKYINHVNCIVIDKIKKYILYFEPTVHIRFNLNKIKVLLSNIADINDYQFIIPNDIGYNSFNGLQKFDNYCQTYILYIFCLILENKNVEPNNFRRMFNSVINKQNIEYFWYYIYNMLINDGFNIDDLEINHHNDNHNDYHNNNINKNIEISIFIEDDYLLIN